MTDKPPSTYGTGKSNSLPCPECGHTKSSVLNSRLGNDNVPYRRRQCGECKFRFTTREVLDAEFVKLDKLRVVGAAIGELLLGSAK